MRSFKPHPSILPPTKEAMDNSSYIREWMIAKYGENYLDDLEDVFSKSGTKGRRKSGYAINYCSDYKPPRKRNSSKYRSKLLTED